MSVRLLLCTSDERLRDLLRAFIELMDDVEMVAALETSAQVLPRIAATKELDVVLVDEHLGPWPAPVELSRTISVTWPWLAVIMVDLDGVEALQNAMENGARGAIPRDPSLEEFKHQVRVAGTWSHEMRRHFVPGQSRARTPVKGSVLALTGAKGGTGATTLAIQLALLAGARKRVCLVDMDVLSGDLSGFLDTVHRLDVSQLAQVDPITPEMLEEVLFAHSDMVHVLLAPVEQEDGEMISSRATNRIIGALRDRYDVVIVDCGAYSGEPSITAVEAADQVLLTATADPIALRAAKRRARLWHRLEVRRHEDILVLLTRTADDSLTPDQAQAALELTVADVTVPEVSRSALNQETFSLTEDGNYREALSTLSSTLGWLSTEDTHR
ncbi:AAA family ATPase [Spirillospora sp. CA-142024]|uniref:AAA family ATPase n=1 Tax=Spirillospora sp. CA-142024 TaxID=3240036 RepID=UPI003D8BBBA2